jgi:glutaredoxin
MSFVLYGRPDCGLCEEMLQALQGLPAAAGIAIQVRDVDAEPLAVRQRYGHKVPVLLYGGELVCHGQIDPDEVHKALKYHGRPV